MIRRPPRSPLFPSTTLFRSQRALVVDRAHLASALHQLAQLRRELLLAGLPQRLEVRGHLGGHDRALPLPGLARRREEDRKSTRLNSSHANISYAVFCLKKKK